MKVTDWKANSESNQPMKHEYDWSKLDAGWEERAGELLYYEGNGTVYPFGVAWLENNNRLLRELAPRWHELHDQARAQLTKCRVEPKPEPSPSYNWNKLEGTGWREGNGAFITNGKFNYWYTLGDRPRLEAFDKFHPDDAVTALISAAAAVEQCRRDWRDEIMEACRGTGMSPVLGTRGTIFTIGNALNVDDQRRMRILSTMWLDCTKLLALSLVIERLKKLGWRES